MTRRNVRRCVVSIILLFALSALAPVAVGAGRTTVRTPAHGVQAAPSAQPAAPAAPSAAALDPAETLRAQGFSF